MACVSMPLEEIKACLPPVVQITCINSQRNVVISGEAEAIDGFVKRLKEERKPVVRHGIFIFNRYPYSY